MSKNTKPSSEPWIDPDDDDAIWTKDHFRRAAVYIGGKLVRPADGTWTKPGRPPSPKKQVTLRLDPDARTRWLTLWRTKDARLS